MAVTWFEHNGKRMLRVDYRGLKTDAEMESVLNEQTHLMDLSPRAVLILNDYTGASISTSFLNKGKAFGKQYDAKIAKIAMLGVTGVKEILLRAFLAYTGSKVTRSFSSEAEALRWLAE